MKRKILFKILLLVFSLFQPIYSKEVILEATSFVKQIKFVTKNGEMLFVEKSQNVNGKSTENYLINNVETSKDDYLKKFSAAQEDEFAIEQEARAKKKREEEVKQKELLDKKKKEEDDFITKSKIQVLKKLIGFELEKVQNSFVKLDRYNLENFFVFESETFLNKENLQQTKVDLLDKAKSMVASSEDVLNIDELKTTLEKLEAVPEKVERFFRASVKFAINQCDDTKRLKELLALI
jgi:hypothetical protein